ncbi:MAG TPA: efflux RND transporter permease subunit, partial [Halothiobacillus sp.]|nr:efflux RND transporter permease subunit [Halothiobacillus sp.]
TVRFEVGENATDAIVRLYNKIYSNQDWLPQDIGVGQPIIKPKGIDDVPIVTLTLWSENPDVAGYDLHKVAHALEAQLKRIPGTREIYTVGGPERVVNIRLDPVRLSGYGIALNDLIYALQAANRSYDAGTLVRDNQEVLVQAGDFISSGEEVRNLVVGVHNGAPVYMQDVADVQMGPYDPSQYAFMGFGAASEREVGVMHPAVTIAIGKKPGTNAVDIANQLIERVELLKGIYIPEGVHVDVTRNYGQTAEDKAMTLIQKLAFATAVVVILVAFSLGWREAVIVGGAVILTLAITLFASWAWGFTLNRVSLFALIFSIGILVDDAIVVVENIHRHMQMGKRKLAEAIPLAVDEVGGPTILATFTVIAALLPMAFVTGLMGPYMSPIPINASMGMLISLIVAFVVTPWMTLKFLDRVAEKHALHNAAAKSIEETGLFRFYQTLLGPMLRERRGAPWRWLMLVVVLVLIGGSMSLGYTKHVVLKMLPFDDKSEFQVIVDMPEGTSLERTAAVLNELGHYIATVPEVVNYQIYVGTASPINFNGLVRQYYLRKGSHVGDIQVNLVHHKQRKRKSHDIAMSVREPLQEIGARYGANVKIVEVPPGPPVQAPIVAEVYGLDYEGQIQVAKALRAYFESTPEIVDVDDSVEYPSEKLLIHVDRQKAALWGVSQETIAFAIAAAIGGSDSGLLHGHHAKYPIPLRLSLPMELKSDIRNVLDLQVR